MSDPAIVALAGGAMLFDASLAATPTPAWFERDYWLARAALRIAAGGRGGVAFLDTPVGGCVLRHYRRGGWAAPLLGDRYLWQSRNHTRSFAEFQLLATLHARGLPVPKPVAAAYRRHGLFYRADLITRTIEGANTLAQCIAAGQLDTGLAERVGVLVGRFHAAGVDHADLNAHNILVAGSELWLIDFDRGEIRLGGTAWKLANLARLKRSLLKVGAGDEATLDRGVWAPLMHGYARAFEAGE